VRAGLTTPDGWSRWYVGYSPAQQLALGGIALCAVGWPLAAVARASWSLARPALFLAWNLALLRLATRLAHRLIEPPAARRPPRPIPPAPLLLATAAVALPAPAPAPMPVPMPTPAPAPAAA
jgi:hypothetical protein